MDFRISPYIAAFKNGVQEVFFGNKGAVISSYVIYSMLLCVFAQIYKMTPVHELGRMGLTTHHLLWYFAVTEGVIVSSRGLAQFGFLVADGRVTEMMQRPVSMAGMVIMRFLGIHLAEALLIVPYGFALLSIFMPISFDIAWLPFFLISFVLGCTLYEMLTYLVGTVEILGPYSRQVSWIVGKLVFSFGGLFFPVMFFPDIMQKIVWMTPFPAVIYVPASAMLLPDVATQVNGILIQIFWIAVLGVAVWLAEYRMVKRVMTIGD